MTDNVGKYNIKAVSNMLGIHAGTLRAWERRYDLVHPVRNDAGHRLYTDDHLKVLKWIIDQIEKGFTVGQAVELLDREEVLRSPDIGSEPVNQIESMKANIQRSLLKFDETTAADYLDHAFNMFSTERVVISILGGILTDVGDLWEKNKITTAHEHYTTAFIRTRIGMVFQSLPVNGLLPRVICVCAPGETHEIGLLVFTFYLRRRGYDTIYLGGGIPEEDVIKVIEETNASYAVISVTMNDHITSGLELVDRIHEELNDVKAGVGGVAIDRMKPSLKRKYTHSIIGYSDDHWLDWMRSKTKAD